MPISGKEFIEAAESEGYDFFTGVPCSLVGDAIAALETHPRLPYVPAVREDVAVGMAAGAWLAGRAPFVIMQNSGLGTSLNAVVSLSLMYRLPAVLLVTWRGHGGKDAPEHLVMGEISPRLLDLIGVPHRVLSADTAAADIAWARTESTRLSQPVALLLPPGVMATRSHGETGGHATGSPPTASRGGAHEKSRGLEGDGGRAGAISGAPLMANRNPAQSVVEPRQGVPVLVPKISRLDALRAAMGAIGDAPVVHANGFICRESFSLGDRPQNFYMIGSMGLASAIGLGVALARPDRPAVVFDGDGNLLMNLGILPMIGGGPLMSGGRPANFVHVVFDNAVYGSTGNQASPSRHARLDAIAAASGYRSAVAVAEGPAVREAVAAALRDGGPAFVLVKVTAEEQPAPRIPYPPEEIRDRFRGALAGAARARR
ncbi:MAG TPA: thiamine pyrophosphate-dependent enzyme [Verrucomicrobiae bacterium]|jgi:phosphonopyruvate decarboxylase|nr:thiamine pyrophosphate-dependent enzyme [Verrucomicrobiae bacterium]